MPARTLPSPARTLPSPARTPPRPCHPVGCARLLTCLCLAVLAAGPARADWPMRRHDPRRTATASSAPASITNPTVFWRYYLGGSAGRSTVLYDAVAKEILYISAGKVISKNPNDTLRWESPVIGAQFFGGPIVDLNGDGTPDLVVGSADHVYVIAGTRGATPGGALQWASDDAEFGTLGAIRIADLNADGKPDVFADECGCCGVNNGSPGVMWSFKSGFGSKAPTWKAPAHGRCGTSAETVGDFDGDGAPDLAFPETNDVKLVRGRDGVVLGTSAAYAASGSPGLDRATCDAANVDNLAGDELICYQSNWQEGALLGGRRVFAYTFKGGAVSRLWSLELPDARNDAVTWVSNSLVDLDGDGRLEVVVGTQSGGKTRTAILDAATGAELGAIEGDLPATLADISADKTLVILTRTPGAAGLSGYRFRRGAAPAVTPLWKLAEDVSAKEAQDYGRTARESMTGAPLAVDLDGDGVKDLLLVRAAKAGGGPTLVAYRGGQAAPAVLSSYGLPENVGFLTLDLSAAITRPGPQVLVTRSDGYLIVLDAHLGPANDAVGVELPVFGLRIGGYVNHPVAVALKPPVDTLLVGDSRGYLQRLDPAAAGLFVPPAVVWQQPGTSQPVGAARLDGDQPGVMCYKSGGKVAALRGDGQALWEKTLLQTPYADPLPGDVNGDGVPDVFVASLEAQTSVMHHNVLDGKTGAALWPKDYTEPLQWGYQPFSVADYNGDGVPDFLSVLNYLRVWSGKDGAQLGTVKDAGGADLFLAYGTPVVLDVDGDKQDEITFQGGYFPARTYRRDLKTALWTGPDDRPYPNGAAAACLDGTFVWAEGSSAQPAQLRLTTMAGPNAGRSTVGYYGGGKQYATLAALRAAVPVPGAIGHLVMKPNLLGPNSGVSAVFGSSDGWLYAVDACAGGAVSWAYDFHAALGEPILADTDGDGRDEVLVAATDGFLYDVRGKVLDPPAWVWDIDAPAVVDRDVDVITTTDTLHARWAAVAGATSYEYAVYSGTTVVAGRKSVAAPTTQVSISGLKLASGERYFVGVRAMAAGGPSVDSASNGVIALLPTPPDASGSADAGSGPDTGGAVTGNGCSCAVGRATGAGSGGLPLGVLGVVGLLGLWAVRRRRRA